MLAAAVAAALLAGPAAAQVAPATGLRLTPSLPSPQALGTPVTFTAAGLGSAGYEYRFFFHDGTATALAQDWSAVDAWSLPAGLGVGTYRVYAQVRANRAAPEASAVFTYSLATSVVPPAAGVVLSALPAAATYAPGTPVTFTAAASGSAGYEYRFWLHDGTTSSLVQDWSAADTWTLPAAQPEGSYHLYAQARANRGPSEAQATLAFALSVPRATGLALAASPPGGTLVVGTPVTFTAAGQGSSGYQYRFWLYDGSGFSLAQDWSALASWTLPAAQPIGAYRVYAQVRANRGAPEAQAALAVTLALTALPPATGLALAASPAGAAQQVGTPVTFTAAGQGSSGYQYRFWLFDGVGYAIVQDWSAAASWTTPATLVAGSYRVHAQVRVNPGAADATAAVPLRLTVLPAPAVASVTPPIGSVAGAQGVTIAGSGFQPGAVVTFGGFFVGTVTATTPTALTVTTPAHPVGPVDVVVANPDGQAALLAAGFTYTAAAPPTLSGLSIASGTSAGGTTVTLAGKDFNPASVSFGGAVAAITVRTATSLSVVTPPHAEGPVDVQVLNVDGQSATLAGAFTYTPPPPVLPAPAIAGVSPPSGSTLGNTVVTVTGSNFVTGTTVTVGGVPALFVTVLTGGQLTATTQAGAAGPADVTVVNPDGQAATLAGGFTYVGPPPVITGTSARGSPVAGGGPIVVAGRNFLPGLTLSIGGAPVADAAIDPLTGSIHGTTPPQPEGFYDILVVNPDGQSASVPNFHYGPAPVPAAMSAGIVKKGDSVAIDGQFFAGPMQLIIGPVVLAPDTVTATRLTFTAPKENPGTYQVIVTNFDGQQAVAPGALVYPGP